MDKTVVELFAGVGGFRVGLNDIKSFNNDGKAIENRDWKFIWANQWEPSTKLQHAYDCYKTRFGDCVNEDINKIDKRTIPNHTLLVGGFPCQDYSVARTKANEKGIEGKKGVLFWDIAEILEIKKPPFVLLENVDRLLKSPASKRGRDFGVMLKTFDDLNYNVEWRVINAADYGAAQRRRRVFIFAYRKDTKYNKEFIKNNTSNGVLISDGLFAKTFKVENEFKSTKNKQTDFNKYKDIIDVSDNFSFDFKNTGLMYDGTIVTIDTTPIYEKPITLNDIREKGNLNKYILDGEKLTKFKYLRGSKKIERTRPNGEKYYYCEGAMSEYDSLDLPGRTMLTSEGSINRSTHIIQDESTNKLRLITPIEAERLQHFPDNWTNTGMPESRRYFMMGNALVTLLINKLEYNLKNIIEKE